MFEFLKKLYQQKSLTLSQLEDVVNAYNKSAPKNKIIKAVNLSDGDYISSLKYMKVCKKHNALQEELQLKEQTCRDMSARIHILEQRLRAYEMMMTYEQKGIYDNSN